MTITIDDEKILQYTKNTSILLVIAFFLTFFILSGKIFRFSESNPVQYQLNYSQLSMPGKGVASSMKKTGEVQSKILTKNTKSRKSGSKFFDEVEKIHGRK